MTCIIAFYLLRFLIRLTCVLALALFETLQSPIVDKERYYQLIVPSSVLSWLADLRPQAPRCQVPVRTPLYLLTLYLAITAHWPHEQLTLVSVRLTFSACGSLQEHAAPQHIVLADQFIDRTKVRPDTFFGEGYAFAQHEINPSFD